MAESIARPAPAGCGNDCAAATSIEALNRACYCLSLDKAALRAGLYGNLNFQLWHQSWHVIRHR